jgi:peptide/nickel transport system substrate-binding protein
VGGARRFLSVPLFLLVALSVACQPAAAPAAKPAESKPAAPAATTAPAAPAAQGAATAKPAEAAKPAESKPAAPAAADKPSAGGQIKVGLNADLTTLDPHISGAAVDRQVFYNLFDTLVRLDTDLSIKPGLAESWTQPDPKTIVFKLRSGVTYHDGEPFNAASVKANIERAQNLPKSARKSELGDVTSVEVVDDLTAKFNLKQPSSPLLSLLTDRAGMMVSTRAADASGDDFARKPVGTGPFSFVEWVKDDRVVLKKNPSYWDKDASGTQLPYLDGVVYKPIPDQTQRLTALKTGTVDIIDIPPSKDIPALKTGADLAYSELPGLAYRYIQLNTKRAPLDNVMIRQAIALAIDRETINKAIFFNAGQPAYQAIPPSSFAFDPEFKANSPRNVDKAKDLVKQSGIANPKIGAMVTNTPEDKQLAEVFKEQLADVGITMDIELIEFATQLDRALKEEFDANILQWSGRPDPDGNIFNYVYSKGSGNRSQYANPEVDKLLEQTRAVSDQAERKKLYSQINKILTDESPMIYIQHRPEVKVMAKQVKGFVHNPDGMMRFAGVSLAR